MKLIPLKIGASIMLTADGTSASLGVEESCRFCGQRAGLHSMLFDAGPACVLCGLVQSLQRPTIDEETRLIGLPEMSQAALNVLVRQVHLDLQDLGESVCCDDTPKSADGTRPVLYMAQRILLERSEVIVERLGSSQAGDLADALTALGSRNVVLDCLPLGGMRIFPTGRFYLAGVNVYDEIVASWRGPAGKRAASKLEQLVEAV
jgi:hypothetical protein